MGPSICGMDLNNVKTGQHEKFMWHAKHFDWQVIEFTRDYNFHWPSC